MSRPIINDVRPSERRSIRIIPASLRSPSARGGGNDTGHDSHAKIRRSILWALVVVCIGVLFYVVSTFFIGATITVLPLSQKVAVNTTLLASKTASVKGSDLQYQLVTLSDQLQKEVLAQGTRMEEKKASGQIVIYNNDSASTQRLIRNTRFQTPEGLIYRISEPVTVPGKKGTVPGSIEVTVYADTAGSDYNIGLTDFTIPGFKTSPTKYKNIYARSKTAMTGGSKGVVRVVKPADEKAARDSMIADLKARLLTSAAAQTPAGYAFFDRATLFNVEQLPNQNKDTDTVILTQKVVLTGLVMERKALAMAVATKQLNGYDEKPIDLSTLEGLEIVPQNMSIGVFDRDPVKLAVSGTASFVWLYNAANISAALVSQKTAQFKEIMANFSEVTPMKAVVRPFWRSTFPDDVARITVVEPEL
ncbi:MAG: hypothetical protein AAB391_00920 [Patescibacteria group bacterium]